MAARGKLILTVFVALVVCLGLGFAWGASGQRALQSAIDDARHHLDLAEARGSILDARVSLYNNNFGDASRHFEDAKPALRRLKAYYHDASRNDAASGVDAALGHVEEGRAPRRKAGPVGEYESRRSAGSVESRVGEGLGEHGRILAGSPTRRASRSASTPASPRSWSLRWPWASARRRPFSASSTACCCGRCRTPMRTESWPSSKSPSKGKPSRLADPNFDDFRDQSRSFQAIAKYNDGVASVSGASQPTRTTAAHVSPDFLEVFGIQPILGRDFSAGDARKGAGPTVLVSDGYWRQHLGSPRDLSQTHLKIDGAVFSVIGVLPAGFRFPADVDLWLPADLDGENPSRTSHNYNAVGRLRDGVTVEQANRDISAIARRIHDSSSERGDYLLKDGSVVPLQDAITGKARATLLVLLGAVGFLLLVACANVANLLLAQASVRGSVSSPFAARSARRADG